MRCFLQIFIKVMNSNSESRVRRLEEELKRLQEQNRSLHATVDLYRSIHDHSEHFTFTFDKDDPNRCLQECRGKWWEENGYVASESKEFFLSDLIDKQDIRKVERVVSALESIPRPPSHIEVRVKNRQGGKVWIRLNAWLIDNSGVSKVHIVGQDVTARKHLETDLRERTETSEIVMTAINTTPSSESVAPILIFLKDQQHRFQHLVNKPLARLYGTEPSKMYGKTDKPFAQSEQEFESWWKDDENVLEHGGPLYRTETVTDTFKQIHHYNTVKIRVSIHGRPFVLGVSTEITNLVEKEKELRSERDRIRHIMNSLPGGVFVKNRQHEFDFVNRTQMEFLGVKTEHEILGKTDHTFFPSEQAEEFWKEEEDIFTTGEPSYNKRRISCKADGSTTVRLITKVPLRSLDGSIKQLIGISRDITHEWELEQSVQKQNALFVQLLNALPQCIFWKDINLQYLGCNQSFAEWHGKQSPQEIVGKDDFKLSNPEDAKRFRSADLEVLRTCKPRKHFRESTVRPGGCRAVLETSKMPLLGEDGKPFGVLGVLEDMSGKLDHYENLVRYMSHSLKAGVAVLELNQIGLRRTFPGVIQVERMESAIRLLRSIVLRARSFSVLGRRGIFKPFKVREVFKTLESLGFDERFKIVIPDDDLVIVGSPNDLEDALLELIDNARVFVPPGGKILIRATRDGSRCSIHIEDNGPGFQGPKIGKGSAFIAPRDPKRTGIGLALVLYTVEKLGGNLTECGTAGKGAHFILDFPLAIPL